MDLITTSESINAVMKSFSTNPLIITLGSCGVVAWFFANIRSIFETIKTFIVDLISFTINNVIVSDCDVPTIALKTIKVFSETKPLWERNVEVRGNTEDYDETKVRSIAYGSSWRIMFGKLIKLDRTYSMQSTKLCTKIEARVFFARKKSFLKKLSDAVEDCNLTDKSNTISVNLGCGITQDCVRRSIDTIYSNDGIEKRIIDDIEKFKNSRHIYEELGSPWKFCGIMYGPGGSGKTSIIKAIASHFNMGIRYLNMDEDESKDILRVISNSKNSIIVAEDFDCITMNANESRDELQNVKKGVGGSKRFYSPFGEDRVVYPDAGNEKLSPISLSTLLNMTDGLCIPAGCIIFFTTNNPEKLDKVFLRDGRINGRYEFTYFNRETSNRMIHDKLGFTIENIRDNICPATLQESILWVKIGRITKEEFINKFKEC